MALRATKMMSVARAASYFRTSLAREDYHTRDREVTGRWGGALAERLGLSGAVDAERYLQVVNNINPATGERLTARTRSNRRIGFDFTFSMPKSLSLHQGLLDSDDLDNAFDAAVQATLEGMEKEMQARVSGPKKFTARDTGNVLYAAFDHFTARPVEGKGADPHRHRHVVLMNATFDPQEQRIKAAEFTPLLVHRPYWQAVFHHHLANNVRDLGYEIERTAHSFELKGYTPETLKRFSRRTTQVEAAAKAKGIRDPARKAELGAKTRAGKAEGLSTADHRQMWWERLTPEEVATVREIEAARSRDEGKTGGREAAEAALDHALLECFERSSVVPRHRVLQSMCETGVGRTTLSEIEAALARAEGEGRILSAVWQGEASVTTAEVLAEEDRMIAYARETRGQCAPFREMGIPLPQSRDGRERPPDWDAAARAILESRDRVTMLIGKAGAGKTTVMQTVADALAGEGRRLHAFAPSAIASRGNQVKAGFGDAETLARLFARKELQEQLRGQVIWCDEAGLVGARETGRLFDLAERLDARVILTGDPRQHPPVSRGDAMRILEQYAEVEPVRLNIIRRQTEAAYRAAAEAISEGRLAEGFERLSAMDAITEIDDPQERYAALARDYADFREKGKSVVVVAPTHYERRIVNESIRAELQARGEIDQADERTFPSWESKGWQDSQKVDPVSYSPGDKIKFHAAAPGFTTGSTATVIGIREGAVEVALSDGRHQTLPLDQAARFEVFEETEITLAKGDSILITKNGRALSTTESGRPQELLNGRRYEIAGFTEDGNLRLRNNFVIASDYATMTYAHGVTSHRSQSLGEDVVLVAESEASFAAASTQQWLVSVTRGKEALRIYTDDREGLEEAVARSAARLSATELVAAERDRATAEAEQATRDRARDWALAMAQQYERDEDEREGVYEYRAPQVEERRRQDVPVQGW